MKLFGRLWWVFGLLDLTANLLNPYVGIFALFNGVAIGFIFCLNINLAVREKELNRNPDNRFVKPQFKMLTITAYIISVIFLIMKIFVSIVSFFAFYIEKKFAAPFQLWSNPNLMSIILLALEIILIILSCISYIFRTNEYRKILKIDNI